MPLDAVQTLVLGTLLGIPAWIMTIGCAITGLVTRRRGWIYAAAVFAIGPLAYFSATPRFQYVAPIGILLALLAMVVLWRTGNLRVAALLAVVPLVVIVVAMTF